MADTTPDEEYKATLSSVGQEEDLREDTVLSKQIDSTLKAIDYYEEYGVELAKQDQETRRKTLQRLEEDQKTISSEENLLAHLSVDISNFKENSEYAATKTAKSVYSYRKSETPLEEAVNSWLRQRILVKPSTIEAALFPRKPAQKIYDAYIEVFVPYDWATLEKHLNNEVATRSILASSMDAKLIPLRLLISKEDLFQSQPTKYQINQLNKDLEEYGKARAEVRSRIEQRQKLFEANIDRFRQLVAKERELAGEGEPAGKEQLTDKEAEDRAGLLASQWAETMLKEGDQETASTEQVPSRGAVVERLTVPTNLGATPVRNSTSTRTQVSSPAQAASHRRIEQSVDLTVPRNERPLNWRDIRAEPTIVVTRLAGFVKGYFQKFFGRKQPTVGGVGSTTGNVATNAVESGAEQIAGKTTEKVTKAVGNVATNAVKSGAEQVAGKATEKVTKKVGYEFLKKAVLLIPGGGEVIAAALEIKDKAVAVYKKVVPKEIQEFVEDAKSKLQILLRAAILYLLFTHPIAFIVGMVGGLILTPFLGPLAPLGYAASFILGVGLENIIASLAPSSGSAVGASAGASASAGGGFGVGTAGGFGIGGGGGGGGMVTSTLSSAASGFGGVATGTGAISIGFWSIGVGVGGVIVTSIFSLIALATGIVVGVASMDQTTKTSFEVTLKVDPTDVPSYDGSSSQALSYTYEIKPSGTGTINITSINSVSSRETQTFSAKSDFPIGVLGKDSPTSKDYTITVPANTVYVDSEIVTVITIKGEEAGSNEEEVKTAIAITKLGHPVSTGPYGYPASGRITSLDTEPAHCANVTNPNDIRGVNLDGTCPSGYKLQNHCGTFLYPNGSRACVDGGLDIAASDQVLSPIDGNVVFSKFDKGPANYKGSTCDPSALPDNEFCYPALGGVVYITNSSGFEVALLHLSKDGLHGLGPIDRGDPVGTTYPGKICDQVNPSLCTSSGQHVHYQVLRNGGNDNFKDNVGTCSDGHLFPALYNNKENSPAVGKTVSAGPFPCN